MIHHLHTTSGAHVIVSFLILDQAFLQEAYLEQCGHLFYLEDVAAQGSRFFFQDWNDETIWVFMPRIFTGKLIGKKSGHCLINLQKEKKKTEKFYLWSLQETFLNYKTHINPVFPNLLQRHVKLRLIK